MATGTSAAHRLRGTKIVEARPLATMTVTAGSRIGTSAATATAVLRATTTSHLRCVTGVTEPWLA